MTAIHDDEKAADANDGPRLGAFSGNYLAAMRSAAEASLAALNTSVNWMLTLSLALAAVVANSAIGADATPGSRRFAFFVLAGSFPVITHFAIRVTKSYINVVRFAALERAMLTYLTDNSMQMSQLVEVVREYHMSWKSPIAIRTMLGKLFFELGFLYPFLALLLSAGYLGSILWTDSSCVVAAAAATAVLVACFEIGTFLKSSYAREVKIDETAQRLH